MAAPDPATLFAAHYGRLFKYFKRAVDNGEAARDLVQEVFLRVTRTPPSQTANGDLSAWLFKIARNLALDYHRAKRRKPESDELFDRAGRPAAQDVGTAVNEALNALPELDRDVFLMREVAGLSYGEIASACELSVDAVRSRIHRTRLVLRDGLAAPIATFRTAGAASRRDAHED
jgi:RNA polymerase sigma-70 factor (ECF subfamily)